jgi:hypothetical protein
MQQHRAWPAQNTALRLARQAGVAGVAEVRNAEQSATWQHNGQLPQPGMILPGPACAHAKNNHPRLKEHIRKALKNSILA